MFTSVPFRAHQKYWNTKKHKRSRQAAAASYCRSNSYIWRCVPEECSYYRLKTSKLSKHFIQSFIQATNSTFWTLTCFLFPRVLSSSVTTSVIITEPIEIKRGLHEGSAANHGDQHAQLRGSITDGWCYSHYIHIWRCLLILLKMIKLIKQWSELFIVIVVIFATIGCVVVTGQSGSSHVISLCDIFIMTSTVIPTM